MTVKGRLGDNNFPQTHMALRSFGEVYHPWGVYLSPGGVYLSPWGCQAVTLGCLSVTTCVDRHIQHVGGCLSVTPYM